MLFYFETKFKSLYITKKAPPMFKPDKNWLILMDSDNLDTDR